MKLKLTYIVSIVIAGLVLTVPAFGQSPATSSAPPAASKPVLAVPSADQILDKYVDAIGGRAAWQKLNSRVSKGTIDIPAAHLTGTLEVHEKAPDYMFAVVTLGGGTFERGFDGTIGWSTDPQNGLRTQSGAELEDTKSQSDFYHPLNLRKYYSKFNVTGTEKIGEHDAYVVEATFQGDVDKMYFDTQTGLLLRGIKSFHSPQGPALVQADLSDYRDVDGIKLPFTVHQSTAESAYTITFTEIHHNVELADSQFAKPAAQ